MHLSLQVTVEGLLLQYMITHVIQAGKVGILEKIMLGDLSVFLFVLCIKHLETKLIVKGYKLICIFFATQWPILGQMTMHVVKILSEMWPTLKKQETTRSKPGPRLRTDSLLEWSLYLSSVKCYIWDWELLH